LGYTHRQALMVEGWQLWAWLSCVLIATVAAMPNLRPPWSFKRQDLWVLIPVLFGLLLRTISLETIPAGLHPDEVTTTDFTIRHIFPPQGQTFYPLRSGPYSQPGLYYYLIYISLQIFGRTFTALRVPGVIAGTLAILATYAMIATRDDRRTALFAAILLSGFHFHLHWSRLALNNVWDTLWIPLVLAAFAWGWHSRWSGGAVIAGLALGISQYFYVGSRIALLLLPVLIIRLWHERSDYRELLVHSGKLLAVAAAAAIPLFIFALDNPDLFLSRATINWTLPRMIGEQSQLSVGETILALGHQAWISFAGFFSFSDYTAFYKPGVPFLLGLSGIFFLAGILLAIYQRRVLLLVWLGITIFFGAFLIPGPPGTSHIIPAVPAMIWLVTLPLSEMYRHGYKRLVPILLLMMIATDIYFYYGIYIPGGADPDLSLPFPEIP
ncbi:MAG: glycosyltransferase family 39 protein, partial [Anaerolineales bacterium]